MRMHGYYSERILAVVAVARSRSRRSAGMHHERLDGSGYHRVLGGRRDPDAGAHPRRGGRLRGDGPAPSSPRRADCGPGRRACSPTEAEAGRFDHDATAAVLAEAGQQTRVRRRARPAGLSEREAEVLTLIAAGLQQRRGGRAAVHLPAHRRAPRPAHLHQDRGVDPSRAPPCSPCSTTSSASMGRSADAPVGRAAVIVLPNDHRHRSTPMTTHIYHRSRHPPNRHQRHAPRSPPPSPPPSSTTR